MKRPGQDVKLRRWSTDMRKALFFGRVLRMGKKRRNEQESFNYFIPRGAEKKKALPCVSLYMLQLRSYKHAHVRKECSLLCWLASGISYRNKKVIKENFLNFVSTSLWELLLITWFMSFRIFQFSFSLFFFCWTLLDFLPERWILQLMLWSCWVWVMIGRPKPEPVSRLCTAWSIIQWGRPCA